MVRAQADVLIVRSADVCFGFVADDFFRNYPRWSPEVVKLKSLSSGPLRVGSLGQQVRIDQGHRSEDSFRVVVLQRARRVAFRGVSSPFVIDYRFDALEQKTRITFAFTLERLSLPLRPFEGPIRRVTQEGAERTVRNIKRLIESEPARSPSRREQCAVSKRDSEA